MVRRKLARIERRAILPNILPFRQGGVYAFEVVVL
jgi:hypothetical protein